MKKNFIVFFTFLGILVIPKISLAQTYSFYGSGFGGGSMDSVTNDIQSNGDVIVYHGITIQNLDNISNDTPYPHVNAGSLFHKTYCNGICDYNATQPFSININTELVGKGSGNYIFYAYSGDSTGATNYCFFSYNGNVGNFTNCGSLDNTTRFISTVPSFLATSTVATSTILNAIGFINQDDYSSGMYLRMNIWNRQAQNLGTGFVINISKGDYLSATFPISSYGSFSISTSTMFQNMGDYYAEYTIEKPYGFWSSIWNFFNPVASGGNILKTTGRFYFTVTAKTQLNLFMDSNVNALTALVNATSTPLSSCGITQFDLSSCAWALIFPSTDQISADIKVLHDTVLVKFPLGYITDFLTIMSTSTIGSLTVVDATLPNVLPGAGSHVHLDLTGMFDSVLNATTTVFNNASASSTQTLYEITEKYWEIIVLIGLVFYLLSRIIGSHIIPDLQHLNTYSQDLRSKTFSKAEAERYRYKEWLYKHKK